MLLSHKWKHTPPFAELMRQEGVEKTLRIVVTSGLVKRGRWGGGGQGGGGGGVGRSDGCRPADGAAAGVAFPAPFLCPPCLASFASPHPPTPSCTLPSCTPPCSFIEALEERLAPPLAAAGQLAMLEAFTRQFDAAAFRKGLDIAFTFRGGGRLVTRVDGQQVGAIANRALASALLQIYLGRTPVSQGAKDSFGAGLAGMVLAA